MRLLGVVVLAAGLTGCASAVRNWSSEQICFQKEIGPITGVGGAWTGPATEEAARRGLSCNTPQVEAKIIEVQTNGMRVVKPEWLPDKGARWAILDCKAKSTTATGFGWVADLSAKSDAFSSCLAAYGFGR